MRSYKNVLASSPQSPKQIVSLGDDFGSHIWISKYVGEFLIKDFA